LTYEMYEASETDREAADAIKLAGMANERAGSANERAAMLESTNLAIQKQLLALRQWRTISPEQNKAFKELTKDILKFPIRVRYGPSATEVQSFAAKIRDMLDYAGFVETNKDMAL